MSCRAVAAVASFFSTTTVIIIVGEVVVEDVAVGCCVTAPFGSSTATAPPSFDSSEGHCFSQCCSTNCRRVFLGVFVFLFWFEHLLGANQV